MSYKLHTYYPGYRAWKIQIAAAYNDVEIEVPLDFKMGEQNKTPDFLRKNPFGKVPVLDTPQGSIFESNAITRYIGRIRNDTDLYGSSFFESSQVDQWMDACANELEPATLIHYYRTSGYMPVDDEQYAEVKKDIEKFLTILDNYLLTRTYLVGNKITLADITVVCALVEVYKNLFGHDIATKFINLNRWFLTCVNQPKFAAVIGKIEIGQSEEKAAPAAAGGEKQGKGKKDKQEKQEKQDKGSKKEKQGKGKKEEAAREEEAEVDPEEEERKQKPKNPLDALPRSNMSLDAVKKLFFEKRPNFDQFFPEFWKNFDAEGYCIYFVDYKYDEDNKVYFMTCNLVAGYIQRLEDMRKYAFGVLNVCGENEDANAFKVNGCFVFRGTEVPALMTDCPDTEYYTLTKVNINNANEKKQVEQCFTAETYRSDPVLDRKYFK